MHIQIHFNKLITAILIAFITMTMSVPREGRASTISPEEVISSFSESLPAVYAPFHFRRSQKERPGSYQIEQPWIATSTNWKVENSFSGEKPDFSVGEDPLFYSDRDSSKWSRNSRFNLISGDFRAIDRKNDEDSRGREHDWDDHHNRDWEGQKDPPSPVSLPASALLLSTGIAFLGGISRIKRFNV